ncbi:Protein ZINC INDUCED FACILITATOR 1 [Smittium mucronatum]|uniref:Protein ZINC INDUCED FACILITATOR 1 n=1 Tax=Smittium mucronatum TaxID=133383 RepID=A0A1R0GQW2_9FUNG|nr:Protein ZINC INDUCED FACILITATOR 1 [Smittium mucronatum]
MAKSAISEPRTPQQANSEYVSFSERFQSELADSGNIEPAVTPIPWRPFVKRSGVGITPGEIGWYVGVISASFALSQATTAIFWGSLSDRIGRKPVLAYGMVGSGISILLFGLTNNFYMALAIRIFAGMINGNVSVVKSVMGEISDPTNRPRMFAILPLCWNVGVIVGPLIGGFLYDPVHKFPSIFKGIEIFEIFPHLLPCLVSVLFYIVGSAITFYMFQESLESKKDPIEVNQPILMDSSSNPNATSTSTPIIRSPSSSKVLAKSSSNITIHSHLTTIESSTESSDQLSRSKVLGPSEPIDERSTLLSSNESLDPQYEEQNKSFKSKFTSTMVTVLVTNSTMTLAHSMFENFFSVWVAADLSAGGLEFSTENISLALGLSGLLHSWTGNDHTHVTFIAACRHLG